MTNLSQLLTPNVIIACLVCYFVTAALKRKLSRFNRNRFYTEEVLPIIPVLVGMIYGCFQTEFSVSKSFVGNIVICGICGNFSGTAYQILKKTIERMKK